MRRVGQDTRGSGALGTAAFKFFFFFSGLRRLPKASMTEYNARRDVFRLRKEVAHCLFKLRQAGGTVRIGTTLLRQLAHVEEIEHVQDAGDDTSQP